MTQDKRALGRIALQKQSPPVDPTTTIEALRALSEKFGVPGLDLLAVAIPLEHLSLLPREIAGKHQVLPVLVQDERIFLAMANPADKRVIDELEFVTGKRVFPYVAPPALLARVIDESYELKMRDEAYYLGPTVPRDVLVKLGLAQPAEVELPPAPPPPPPPPAPLPPVNERGVNLLRASQPLMKPLTPPPPAGQHRPPPPRRNSDAEIPRSVLPPKLEPRPRGPAFVDNLVEGDFSGGSELSTVTEVPTPSRPNAPPLATGGVPGKSRLVLVVDDEEEIRRLLKRVLIERGYRVVEADRGTTALRLVKEHVPDLIILDAMLPELHGFEICRRIKGSAKYGQIPIVMVSAVYRGWRYAEDLKQNYGVDHFLEKPFKISDVMKAIESSLSRHKDEARPDLDQISADADKALQAGIAAYQAGDLDTAIEQLQAGSKIDPLAYRLHYHLGLLYGKKGQIYEAIQALETAVEINGRHFPALKNLAVLYQKAGLKLKAIEMWERAASQAPDDDTKKGIKDHLVTLL